MALVKGYGHNHSVSTESVQVTDNANLTRYRPESGGAEVHYYRVEKHDHVWPGGDTDAKKTKDESGTFFVKYFLQVYSLILNRIFRLISVRFET